MSAPSVLFSHAQGPAGEGDLVTVVVSLYNYEGEIARCLDSVFAQTHARLEVVVVDDVSTDRSAAVAEAWLRDHAPRFEHVTLLQPAVNRGLSAARNLAFETASADYVFVLDADNTLLPPAIGRLLEVLQDTGAAVAYSQLIYFGELSQFGVGNIWRRDGFLQDNYIDAMALIRKSAWAEVGGYSPMDYGWEDYDLWCKFVEAGLFGVYVPEMLCRYRVHLGSMRHTDTASERTRLVHAMLASHPWLDLKA